MAFSVVHLGDMIDELGEDKCQQLVANFSCPFDSDIEYFLKKKAIMLQNMSLSRTYLVYSSYKNANVLVCYFAIAFKVLNIRKRIIPSMRKKLTGGTANSIKEIPVFLIGQLSKNYYDGLDKLQLITGEDLLRLAFQKIINAQRITGGRIILVECRDSDNLINFYTKHGFSLFDKDENDGLLRFLRPISGITVV